MDNTAIDATTIGKSVATTDLSAWGLFINADLVVQLVMLSLIVASIWCWTIIFSKVMRLRDLQSLAEKFEEAFWSGGSLDSLYDRVGTRPTDPFSSIFAAAMKEWRRSLKGKPATREAKAMLQQRIERIMHVTVDREMDQLERHLPFLASVGSTAPFVGLFGTVWGIMHSFQGIASSQSTNLAVVAPGIAEALFATAIGLVAAIPAVLAYNKISTELGRYGMRLDSFANEFSAIISRQLEEVE
ncbi:MAG: protein TolQ [Candidatus Paracaedimonas acanthamoebae]|uniref:Tol-Pal system protein TolQ n=1 Tax=Candidatus Paracaedimonas acanthamoebae TaxID=244581 RepID=A0A8J7PXI7_9PROT|nr:protein TolQ [Candidatus Paracaedimonas acanthamoebae]